MDKIVDFSKGRVVEAPKPEGPKPTLNKYLITYADGRQDEVEGSLITTTAFFAVGIPREIDMDFRWASPLANVHSIKAI